MDPDSKRFVKRIFTDCDLPPKFHKVFPQQSKTTNIAKNNFMLSSLPFWDPSPRCTGNLISRLDEGYKALFPRSSTEGQYSVKE